MNCLFTAENTTCMLDKNKAIVKMEGVKKGNAFRCTVLKFQIDKSKAKNKKNVVLIVLVVLAVLIVVSCVFVVLYFCYFKKKREQNRNSQSYSSLI